MPFDPPEPADSRSDSSITVLRIAETTRQNPLSSESSGQPARPRVGRWHDETRYGIYPVVHPKGARLWAVAISRAGRFIQGRFPHLKYGGEAPALEVAQAFRDAVLRATEPMTNRDVRTLMRGNRVTGMPGVFYEPATERRPAYWLASTHMHDGRNRTRRFNVDRHGEAEAERLAEAERVRMLEAVEDIDAPALRSPSAFAIEERLAPEGRPDADAPVAEAARDPLLLSDDERAQIVRAVSRRGHACWRVGLYRAGRLIGFDFPDDLHGGEAPALFVARAYRTAVLAVVPPLRDLSVADLRPRRPGRMPGVYRSAGDARRGPFWIARVQLPDGQVKARHFGVGRYGEVEAQRLAEQERLRMLDALEH